MALRLNDKLLSQKALDFTKDKNLNALKDFINKKYKTGLEIAATTGNPNAGFTPGNQADEIDRLIDLGYQLTRPDANVSEPAADTVPSNDTKKSSISSAKQKQLDDLLGVNRSNPDAETDTSTASKTDTGVSETGSGEIDTGKAYNPYDSLIEAQNYINEQLAKLDNRTPYTDKLDQLINSYMSRGNFSYDPNADMLYQNYLAAMQNAGQKAMKDTMGQAAMLTGGYGSTYATAAANGAYNDYIQQANQALPDYYNMAREAYADESNQALQNIKLLQGQDEDYYNRYVNNLKLGMQREGDLYDRYMSAVSGAEEKPYTNIQYRDIYKDILAAYEEGGEDAALTAALAYKYLPNEDMEKILAQVKDYSNLQFTMTKNSLINANDEYTDQNGKVWTRDELEKLHEEGRISDRKWADITGLKKNQSTYKK